MQIKYKGFNIEIKQDQDPQNPRTDWDHPSVMICFHRRLVLGDQKHGFTSGADVEKFLQLNKDKVIQLPIYGYEHSGLTIATSPFSCPWDSGRLGVIYISKEKARKDMGWKVLTKARVEEVYALLRSEVEAYNQYLCGDVYGYQITDDKGQFLDSCWGFFGSDHKESGLLAAAEKDILFL